MSAPARHKMYLSVATACYVIASAISMYSPRPHAFGLQAEYETAFVMLMFAGTLTLLPWFASLIFCELTLRAKRCMVFHCFTVAAVLLTPLLICETGLMGPISLYSWHSLIPLAMIAAPVCTFWQLFRHYETLFVLGASKAV